MKKLLILTAVVMLTIATSGCTSGPHWCDWLWRGSSTNQYPAQTPVYSNPCCANPCDPCAGGGIPAGAVAAPAPCCN
jgi:hypothetical protein